MINRKTLPVIFVGVILIVIACWIIFYADNDGVISLQWNSNRESDLAGYKIYYGTSPGSYSNSVVVPVSDGQQPAMLRHKLT